MCRAPARETVLQNRATACELPASRKKRRAFPAKSRTSARFLLFLLVFLLPLYDFAKSFPPGAGPTARPRARAPHRLVPCRAEIFGTIRRVARYTFPLLRVWRNATNPRILLRSGLRYRTSWTTPLSSLLLREH